MPSHRKSTRLSGYDYSLGGVYYVTIQTFHSQPLFGNITNGKLELNQFGEIACGEWARIPKRFQHIELDTFIVMPTHTHVVLIDTVHTPEQLARMTEKESRNRGLAPGSLGAVVGAYKSSTARLINSLRRTPGEAVWQRNYYEEIIRNEDHWRKVREYINSNPEKWENGKE